MNIFSCLTAVFKNWNRSRIHIEVFPDMDRCGTSSRNLFTLITQNSQTYSSHICPLGTENLDWRKEEDLNAKHTTATGFVASKFNKIPRTLTAFSHSRCQRYTDNQMTNAYDKHRWTCWWMINMQIIVAIPSSKMVCVSEMHLEF